MLRLKCIVVQLYYSACDTSIFLKLRLQEKIKEGRKESEVLTTERKKLGVDKSVNTWKHQEIWQELKIVFNILMLLNQDI